MKDDKGDVIYVGKAASLRSRVRSYFQKGQTHWAKVEAMLSNAADVDWLVTDSEVEALMLECNLIKEYRPRYNVRLRDDKHYPYLCVTTSEPFPRVIIVRRVKQDGNRYFGPYTDSSALRESLRLIRRVFRIRSCSKKLTGSERDRPCLNLHLGQCESPCSGQIRRDDYTGLVRDACLFLEGRQESLARRIEKKMLAAAEATDFERAARLRDQLQSIHKLVARQKVISTKNIDQDVVSVTTEAGSVCVQLLFIRSGKLVGQNHFLLDGVADEGTEDSLEGFIKRYYRDAAYVPKEILVSREPAEKPILEDWLSLKRGSKVRLVYPKRGEKRRIVEMAVMNAALAAAQKQDDEARNLANVEDLRESLGLEQTPLRIEAYDISNIQGRQAVASMVVFQDGVPVKSEYRRFKIRTVGQPNDCAMMREAIRRRLAHAGEDPKFSTLPNLILVDGGKGQLSAALEAASEIGCDIPVVSLAKQLEEIYTPASAEPIILSRASQGLRLLQRIRDEAHRFALAYHHKLREKQATRSILDGIPGIGSRRRKALIRRFGSVAGVRAASVEQLVEVPGITKPLAEAVYEQLHSI